MIAVYAMVGLFMGSILNGLADYLPHLACQSTFRTGTNLRFRSAIWALVKAVISNNSNLQQYSLSIAAIVELFSAVLVTYLGLLLGLNWNWLVLAIICAFFLLVAIIDLKYRLILNVMVFPAILILLLFYLVSPNTNLLAIFIGGVFGFVIFALAALLRPGQLGEGDIKLATLIGLVFGFPYALWALMIGIIAGGLTAVILLITRRGSKTSQIPYAPFLCFGVLIALFYNPLPSYPISNIIQLLTPR